MTCARVLLVATIAVGTCHPLSAQTSSSSTPVLTPSAPCLDADCTGSNVSPDREAIAPTTDGSSPTSDAPRGFVADNLKPLGSDFKHLFTVNNALIVAIGGAAALAVHPGDQQVTSSFAGSHTVDETLDPGSVIGGGMIQFGAALGTYAIGRMAGKNEVAHLGADLFRAQVVTSVLTQGIKFAADRTRPDGSNYSFPSGHTSSAFATATVLQRHYGWKVGLPAYALAGYVGGSRLAENRHYLSDVLFGAAIGIIGGRAVTFGHGSHQFALTPIAVPGGAGVGLVHIGSH
jgi:membrane-associated phospholipid phosphatase